MRWWATWSNAVVDIVFFVGFIAGYDFGEFGLNFKNVNHVSRGITQHRDG
jgi:hypothetical protein